MKSLFRKKGEGIKLKKHTGSHIPIRLNMLFFVVFLLMISLVGRLFHMQVMTRETYAMIMVQTNNQTVRTPSARGEIFDAQGRPLVTNTAQRSITFTRGVNISVQTLRNVAMRLNELVAIEPGNLTDRDRIDFFLADRQNYDAVRARLTNFDLRDENGNNLPPAQVYATMVENVTLSEINFPPHEVAAAYTFRIMNATQQHHTSTITSTNITDQDVAVIGEHESELGGIGTSTSWAREFDSSLPLSQIFGAVSSEATGIPAEYLDYFLEHGYARNDRVGTTWLERQYEFDLQGTPELATVELDSTQQVTNRTVTQQAAQGDSLRLTIDLDFQRGVEQIVRRHVEEAVSQGRGDYSIGAEVVVMNPNTGGILAMVGIARDVATGDITYDVIAPFNSVRTPGSTVKGATVASGFEAGVIHDNDVLIDRPIVLQGTPPLASVFNQEGTNNISISATQSIEYSSNSYMMQLAIRMLGQEYFPNMVLSWENRIQAFEQLRGSFAQFGMGIRTGLDLPIESPGLVPMDFDRQDTMGQLLNLSYGQFDEYTALQLATYAATVANGGRRPTPHLVSGIYTSLGGALGELVRTIPQELEQTVNITPRQMQLIQQGFIDTVHRNGAWTTGRPLRNSRMPIAAKTGTAEITHPSRPGEFLVNSNVVSYAPFDNPQIAMSVVFGSLDDWEGQQNMHVTTEVMDLYHDMFFSRGLTPG